MDDAQSPESPAAWPTQSRESKPVPGRPDRQLQKVTGNECQRSGRQTVAQHDDVLRMRHKQCANKSLRGQAVGDNYLHGHCTAGDDGRDTLQVAKTAVRMLEGTVLEFDSET